MTYTCLKCAQVVTEETSGAPLRVAICQECTERLLKEFFDLHQDGSKIITIAIEPLKKVA